jgi:hypothetical protein
VGLPLSLASAMPSCISSIPVAICSAKPDSRSCICSSSSLSSTFQVARTQKFGGSAIGWDARLQEFDERGEVGSRGAGHASGIGHRTVDDQITQMVRVDTPARTNGQPTWYV